MERFKPFYNIANDPVGYARQWKARFRSKVVGYFCSYVPEEIIWAGGALPYRILNGGGANTRADVHLQAYACSLIRGSLDDALNGRLDFLDGTVFPHTCDSIQRLSDIWRLNTRYDFHLDLVLPVKLNTDSAESYMQALIQQFRRDLAATLNVDIGDDKLKNATQLFNQIRSDVRCLYAFRQNRPTLLSSQDLYSIIRASLVMDRSELSERLTDICEWLDARPQEPQADKKPVVLTGGVCSMPDIYQQIEDAGATVIGDDLCTGARYFEGHLDSGHNPLEAIGQRYFKRINCPAKHRDCCSRGDHLLKIVEKTGSRGVIFVMLKFCDPHAFDYPYIRDLLDRAGVPSLLLEIEEQYISIEQMRTRLEAFIEMI